MIKFNINKYDYQTRPSSTVRSYNIYSLNDNGFHKYIQKDSDALQYLLYPHLEDILAKKESQEKVIQEEEAKETPSDDILQKEDVVEIVKHKPKNTRAFSSHSDAFEKKKAYSIRKPKNMNVKTEIEEKDNLRSTVVCLRKKLHSTGKYFTSPQLGHYGFTPQNLPRLDHMYLTNPTTPNSFNKTVRESLYNNKIKRTINDRNLIEENNRFRGIISKKENLPKMLHKFNATDFKVMKIQKTKNHGTYMGEKYNPFNNDYHFLKSAGRRNVYGSLFQH